MSKDCILSVLYIKKSRAKPPARKGCSAYASESDIHNSSIVIRHFMKFHTKVSEDGRFVRLIAVLDSTWYAGVYKAERIVGLLRS